MSNSKFQLHHHSFFGFLVLEVDTVRAKIKTIDLLSNAHRASR